MKLSKSKVFRHKDYNFRVDICESIGVDLINWLADVIETSKQYEFGVSDKGNYLVMHKPVINDFVGKEGFLRFEVKFDGEVNNQTALNRSIKETHRAVSIVACRIFGVAAANRMLADLRDQLKCKPIKFRSDVNGGQSDQLASK